MTDEEIVSLIRRSILQQEKEQVIDVDQSGEEILLPYQKDLKKQLNVKRKAENRKLGANLANTAGRKKSVDKSESSHRAVWKAKDLPLQQAIDIEKYEKPLSTQTC